MLNDDPQLCQVLRGCQKCLQLVDQGPKLLHCGEEVQPHFPHAGCEPQSVQPDIQGRLALRFGAKTEIDTRRDLGGDADREAVFATESGGG
jgi:hypothetical protein